MILSSDQQMPERQVMGDAARRNINYIGGIMYYVPSRRCGITSGVGFGMAACRWQMHEKSLSRLPLWQ